MNSVVIGLTRLRSIPSRLLSGYVQGEKGQHTGHAITEIRDGERARLYDGTPIAHYQEPEEAEKTPPPSKSPTKSLRDRLSEIFNRKRTLSVYDAYKRFAVYLRE